MTDAPAILSVVSAGPMVSIQDVGRPRHRRFGIPASGPMDRRSAALANAAVGNDTGAPLVEVSAGGLGVECTVAAVTVSVVGGSFLVDQAGHRHTGWCVRTLGSGERLDIRAGPAGNWCYLAVAGSLRVGQWLGSAATHVPSGRGGGVVDVDTELAVDRPRVARELDGVIDPPTLATGPGDAARPVVIRIVPGPQEHRFVAGALDRLVTGPFRATAGFDRMGLRLEGPDLELADALSIPSEAVTRGA
ncbi:MAG: allophanate hydrolase, partial [Actinomycetota bacterium]